MNNVFVLNTGRCGSVTFFKACQHISNYTCGHETNKSKIGTEHYTYPDNHIEIDNRLIWFTGELDIYYDAIFVHLMKPNTYQSMLKRFDTGMMLAFNNGICQGAKGSREDIAKYYVNTVDRNIRAFLKNKGGSQKHTVVIGNIKKDFVSFWNKIKAEGDLESALKEFDVKYNSHEEAYSKTNIYRKLAMLMVHYEISYKFVGIITAIGVYLLNVYAWLGVSWGIVTLIVAVMVFIFGAKFYKKHILPEVQKIYSLSNPIMKSIYEREK